MHKRYSWVSALWIFVLLTPCARADTRLIFPRVVFQNGHWTGFAIANPTSNDATITLTAYKSDGVPFQDPVTKTIDKGSLIVKLSTELFNPSDSIRDGATATYLWVDVTSSVTGLTGFYLEGNGLDSMDGSDLSGIGSDLSIPIIEVGNGAVTDISIVNLDTAQASVTIDFFKSDGSKATSESSTKTIPPHGALQGPLSAIFTGIDFSQVATMRMHGDRPMGCYATIYRRSDDSLIAIAGQNASSPSKTLAFPQLAEGNPWATSVGIHNISTAATQVTLTAYQGDGTLFGPPIVKNNPVSQQVSAGGVLRGKLKDLFGFQSGSQQTGWLKVEADSNSINGYVEYGAGSTRALVPAQTKSYRRAIFSYQVLAGDYFTGLAILNPGSLASNIEVSSLKKDGTLYGRVQHALKPGQKESLLIQQWVPKTSEAKSGDEGVVFVKTERDTVATQLFGTNSFSALANISPQEVTTSWDPGGSAPKMIVTPTLWVVETGKQSTFNCPNPVATWKVDGVQNGSDVLGNIIGSTSTSATYKAPNDFPGKHNITIEAHNSFDDLVGGATVDIVRRDTVASGLTLLTAVAYFDSLNKFFVAEQRLLTSAPGERHAAATQTLIEQMDPSLTKTTLATIPSETIPKIIQFSAGGNDYLLMAGYDTGQIYRLQLKTGELPKVVKTGLNKPNSIALDPITGNLLVSESGANRITEIPRATIAAEPGQISYDGMSHNDLGSTSLNLALVGPPQGLAFDLCTGTLYYILASGELHEYKAGKDALIISGLNNPRQIQVVYRVGMSCQDGLALVVTETDQVTLIFPHTGVTMPFITGTNTALDLSFFPTANPFNLKGEPSVIIGEGPPNNYASQISGVLVGGIYTNVPPVQVPKASQTGGSTTVPYEDPQGDTLATVNTTQQGLKAPDLRSISSYSYSTITPFGRVGLPYVSITLQFQDAVSPYSFSQPDSLSGFVYLDSRAGGAQDDVLNRFNPFAQSAGFLIDYVVDLSTAKIRDTATGVLTDVTLQYWGNVVNILIPDSLFSLSSTKAVVLIGNRAEMTDMAPNSGSVQLAP